MKIKTDGIDPSVEPVEDKVHLLARSMISALPGIGGPALEVFNSIIQPPIEKRKLSWMLQVSEALNELQEKASFEIDKLSENEKFISLLMHTSSIAIKTHHKDKLKVLKNCLVNSATGTSLSDDQEFIFVKLIDDFSLSHLKILEFTHLGFAWSPKSNQQGHSIWLEFSRVLLSELKEISNNSDFIYQIISDLQAKQLVETIVIDDVQKHDDGRVSVMGKSNWNKFQHFQPRQHHKLNPNSQFRYVTLPTELGLSFLNFVLDSEIDI